MTWATMSFDEGYSDLIDKLCYELSFHSDSSCTQVLLCKFKMLVTLKPSFFIALGIINKLLHYFPASFASPELHRYHSV